MGRSIDALEESRLISNTILGVLPDTLVTVLMFTPTSGVFLNDIYVSSNVTFKMFFYIDGERQLVLWSSADNRNISRVLQVPLLLSQGQVLELKVRHYFESNAEFDASFAISK